MKSKKLPVILAIIAILLVVFFGFQALGGGDEPADPATPVVDPVTPEGPGNEDEYVEYTFRNSKLLEEKWALRLKRNIRRLRRMWQITRMPFINLKKMTKMMYTIWRRPTNLWWFPWMVL